MPKLSLLSLQAASRRAARVFLHPAPFSLFCLCTNAMPPGADGEYSVTRFATLGFAAATEFEVGVQSTSRPKRFKCPAALIDLKMTFK